MCGLKSVIMQSERWSLCFQQNLKSVFIIYFFTVNDTLYFVRRVAAVRENIRPSCPGKNSALKVDSEKLVTVYQFTRWHIPEKKNGGQRISDRVLVSEIQRSCS